MPLPLLQSALCKYRKKNSISLLSITKDGFAPETFILRNYSISTEIFSPALFVERKRLIKNRAQYPFGPFYVVCKLLESKLVN